MRSGGTNVLIPNTRAIHRGDYQNVLLAEALKAGVKIVTDAEVTDVETAEDGSQRVLLKDESSVDADVVIGADGMFKAGIMTESPWLTLR